MMGRLKRWWQLKKIERTRRKWKRAHIRARVARRQRRRIESIYPDRKTLPISVWLQEFARFWWVGFKYKRLPLRWLDTDKTNRGEAE